MLSEKEKKQAVTNEDLRKEAEKADQYVKEFLLEFELAGKKKLLNITAATVFAEHDLLAVYGEKRWAILDLVYRTLHYYNKFI